jgi:porcupine-like protein
MYVLHRWWIAYRDALSFRSSHYFVCFLSEASAIMSGFGHHEDEPWSLSVARPQFIEIPRSLVQVVVYWNVPMHNWLKNCEYRGDRLPIHNYYSYCFSRASSGFIIFPFLYQVLKHSSEFQIPTLKLYFNSCVTSGFLFSHLCIVHALF